VSGWHRGDHKKHPRLSLSQSWKHDSGAAIYQGRPFAEEPDRFVYRLELADGSSSDHSLLRSAKSAVEVKP
jgi:hypothetical protein